MPKLSQSVANKVIRSPDDNPSIKRREKPVKEFSDREIRQKIQEKVEQSNSAKNQSMLKSVKQNDLLGSSFLNEEALAAKKQEQAQEKEKVQAQEKVSGSTDNNKKVIESENQLQKTTISVEKIEKPSDVGLNDPKDPLTASKLKSVLDMGAFNFSSKEREVLEKILG